MLCLACGTRPGATDRGGGGGEEAGAGGALRADAGTPARDVRETQTSEAGAPAPDAAIAADGSTPDASDDTGSDTAEPAAGAGGLRQLLISRAIGLGYYHACHILPSRDLRCFGMPVTDNRFRPPPVKSELIDCSHDGCCVLQPPSGPRLRCWWYGNNNAIQPPDPVNRQIDPVYFGIGYKHGCSLNTDSTVTCWGQSAAMASPPPGLRARSIAVASFFNCAVRMDDSVVCWGINPPLPPAGLRAKQVAVAFHGSKHIEEAAQQTRHACAIQLDDTVVCWGDDVGGGTVAPAGLGKVKDLALATFNSCAIKPDGQPVCWGSMMYATTPERHVPMVAGLRLKGIRAKLGRYCGLQMDDSPSCWGDYGRVQATVPAGLRLLGPE